MTGVWVRRFLLVALLLCALPLASASCKFPPCLPVCEHITHCWPIGAVGASAGCPSNFVCQYSQEVYCGGEYYPLTHCRAPPAPVCGDGTLDPGEECDGSNLNGLNCTTVPGSYDGGWLGCTENCTYDTSLCLAATPAAQCGNGIVEIGEECDDRNKNELDGCSNTCTTTSCVEGSPQPAAADLCSDGSIYRNECDAEHTDRELLTRGALRRHFNEPVMNDPTASVKERYPAALFYFSEPTSSLEANTLLTHQLGQDVSWSSLTAKDALYLAWILKTYGGNSLSAANENSISNLLSGYSVSPLVEDETFLSLVVAYLYEEYQGTPSCPTKQYVVHALREKGDTGWESSSSPAALGNVVVALAALLESSNDPGIRVLAEMNLDMHFARFAALNAAGSWGGVRAGDTLENDVFSPTESPWYGWSYLLFGTTTAHGLAATEPGLLVSGYCANEAVRGISASRFNPEQPNYDLEVRETFSDDVKGAGYAIATPAYVLGGSEDVTAQQFTRYTSPHNYVTRASLRFTDNPHSFLLFTSRTGTDSSPYGSDALDNGGTYLPPGTKDIMLGTLGGSSCREGHVFIGDDLNFVAQDFTRGISLLEHNGIHLLLRFLHGFVLEETVERYAPQASFIPPFYDDPSDLNSIPEEQGGKRGWVLRPSTSDGVEGIFALEIIPQTVVSNFGGDSFLLLDAAIQNTSLTYDGTSITYTSLLNGDREFTYTPGISGGDPNPDSFDDFSLRNVKYAGSPSRLIDNIGSDWFISARLDNAGRKEQLDFTTTTFAELKQQVDGAGYVCPGAPPTTTTTETVIPSTGPERLGFLAGSLLSSLDGRAYTLDCGAPSHIFPNHHPVTGENLVISACILEHDGERTIGLVYNENAPNVLQTIFLNLQQYYPFANPPSGLAPPALDLCDTVANTQQGLDFHSCGDFSLNSPSDYGRVYAMLSPDAKVLLLSSESNPFTHGFLDNFFDFFRNLFGSSGAAADPDATEIFSRAYFWSGNGKEYRAKFLNGEAELFFENFGESVQPLLNSLGVTATYQVGNNVQQITVESISDTAWGSVTRKLRINPDFVGDPGQFSAICGDGEISFGEQCDPNAPVSVTCGDGTGTPVGCFGPGSATPCMFDNSSCAPRTCVDQDGDGYNNTAATPGLECGLLNDCDDFPRNVTAPDGTTVDCSLPALDCNTLYGSMCPQCKHPGRSTDVCDDYVDNDCDGEIDESNCNPGSSGAPSPFSCAESAPGCPFVCGEPLDAIPEESSALPTTTGSDTLSCECRPGWFCWEGFCFGP